LARATAGLGLPEGDVDEFVLGEEALPHFDHSGGGAEADADFF
jgi:hypothetical protein